jgi:hypothetical protein
MSILMRLKLAWAVLFGVPLVGDGEVTSPKVAALAARGLAQPMSLNHREIRTVCASALTQAPDKRGKA